MNTNNTNGYAMKRLLGLRTGGSAPRLADPPAPTLRPFSGVLFRACPRCLTGTLDMDGDEAHCINCGHRATVTRIAPQRPWQRGSGKAGRPRTP